MNRPRLTPLARPNRRRRTAHSARPRGAALLTAMIIVALVATLASSMVWQQWQAVQLEAGERAQAQAEGILSGALDWSRLILREDLRESGRQSTMIGADHLGEIWATPLAEARVSTFLAADKDNTSDAPDAFLSGMMVDAQSRYNLRNLIAQDGTVSIKEAETVRKLGRQAGLSDAWSNALIERVGAALLNGHPGATPSTSSPRIMPPDENHLEWLGLDTPSLKRLRPWIVLLPEKTKVNLNTAPREVILSVVEGAELAGVERLLVARQRQYLRSVADAQQWLGQGLILDAQRLDIKTNYFEVIGALRQGPLTVVQRSLVKRESLRNIRTIRTERISPEELATSSAMH